MCSFMQSCLNGLLRLLHLIVSTGKLLVLLDKIIPTGVQDVQVGDSPSHSCGSYIYIMVFIGYIPASPTLFHNT